MSDKLQSNEQSMEHSNGGHDAHSCAAVTLPIRIGDRGPNNIIRSDEYSIIIDDPKGGDLNEAANETMPIVEDNDKLSSSSSSSLSSSSAYWEEFIREFREKYPTAEELARGIIDDYCGHPLEILQEQLFLSSMLPKPSDEVIMADVSRLTLDDTNIDGKRSDTEEDMEL